MHHIGMPLSGSPQRQKLFSMGKKMPNKTVSLVLCVIFFFFLILSLSYNSCSASWDSPFVVIDFHFLSIFNLTLIVSLMLLSNVL